MRGTLVPVKNVGSDGRVHDAIMGPKAASCYTYAVWQPIYINMRGSCAGIEKRPSLIW